MNARGLTIPGLRCFNPGMVTMLAGISLHVGLPNASALIMLWKAFLARVRNWFCNLHAGKVQKQTAIAQCHLGRKAARMKELTALCPPRVLAALKDLARHESDCSCVAARNKPPGSSTDEQLQRKHCLGPPHQRSFPGLFPEISQSSKK